MYPFSFPCLATFTDIPLFLVKRLNGMVLIRKMILKVQTTKMARMDEVTMRKTRIWRETMDEHLQRNLSRLSKS